MKQSQQGVFSVEFALVVFILTAVIAFTIAMVEKQSMIGQLDRAAYGATSVIKERTKLFDRQFTLSSSLSADVHQIMVSSLNRTMKSFDASALGGLYQVMTFSYQMQNGQYQLTPNPVISYRQGQVNCHESPPLSDLSLLAPETELGSQTALYRVTLCYERSSVSSRLMPEIFGKVSAQAAMLGR